MITVLEPRNYIQHSALLEDMFRLRARVFDERLKWDVAVSDGAERDRYDDEGPVYILETDDRTGALRGSLRLLPTTGRTLLADCFSDTIPDAASIIAPSIWECTRFCVDSALLGAEGREEILFASSSLIIALGQLAIRVGIASVLGNFDAAMLRLYRQVGCDVEVLGVTRRYGKPVFLGSFPVSETNVRRLIARREALTANRLRPAARTLAA